ncbi:MAG: protein kinase, partial [Myxococcota bacterium]|nr:protein kinase [Myxococcota bacterium]
MGESAVDPHLTDPTGRQIRFIAPLGRGGFGAVYLAEVRTPDGLTHKQAIKLLHADLELDEDLAARARDEARLMSQLHHDHVVAVHALTRLDERWAVFMEYVNGIDAGALLAKHPKGLPPKVAVAMLERACAALDAAWNQPSPETGRPLRVVHRDLKPANLMISVEGTVKVMDFGVARADFEREAHTQSTQYGTGRYMAPERWLHIRAEHASDVYALGVTLWELLLAQRFERMPLAPAHFDAKLAEQLSLLGPERDPTGQIAALLHDMLAFDEEARPSAHQAMETLEEILEGLSGPSLRRFARAKVPPLLKSRREDLLHDSQVWPHTPRSATRSPTSPSIAPTGSPTSSPTGSPTGSGPTDHTAVERSASQPQRPPVDEPSAPTLA